tara:strand:- start:853 stop:1626 length:774 start_codon:yes stop_codon:yes gene_type:complete
MIKPKDLKLINICDIITITAYQIGLDGCFIKNKWEEVTNSQGFNKTVRTNQGESTTDKVINTYNQIISGDYGGEFKVDNELVIKVYDYWRSIEVKGKTIIKEKWDLKSREYKEVKTVVYSHFDDYMVRVKHYGSKKQIEFNDIVRLVPAINTYFEYENKKSNPKSKHIGSVGEKVNMEVTVLGITSFEGSYGETNVYNLIDGDNNRITKFGRINKRYLVNGDVVKEGSKLRFKAEIKKHDEYRGENQTTIGRVSKFS